MSSVSVPRRSARPSPRQCTRPLVLALIAVLASSRHGSAHPLFALTGDNGGCSPACNATIEVLDLDTMTLLRNLPLGPSTPASLAVSPDGSRCYVSDTLAGGVRVIDGNTGASGFTIPMTAPGDLVLSSNGARLYVVSGSTVLKVDTTTSGVAGSGSLGTDQATGIALSRDGSVLGVAANDGGFSGAIHLFDADSMGLLGRVPLSDPSCTEYPDDLAFTDTGRVIVWDAQCDNFYQVDVATRTQIVSDTVDYVNDTGTTLSRNVARFSALSGTGYGLTVDNGMAVLTPSPPAGTLVPGFAGVPQATALTPDERYLLVSVFAGSDTLDTYDVTVGNFSRAVYTFGGRANEHVLDMQAPSMEVRAEGLLRVARMLGNPPRIPYTIFATTPCTHPDDIPICDEALAPVDEYHDPVLPVSDPCNGTLVFLAYDSDHDVAGTIDDIIVTKDPLSPGACLVSLR